MQIEAAFSLSEEYYKFMSDFAQTSFEDDKLLGKFYTDFTVAKRMVETIVENVKLDVFSRDIKLIDPFCGDGRLISETIIQLIQKDIIHGRKLYISLWDIDEVAVNVAKQNVEGICNTYQLSYEIDAKKYDAFVGCQLIKGHYDICVTNPPWSLLKPQKLFNKSNNEEALEAYRVAIEKYDGFMKSEFPISQPSRKFGKWGTNLARCGTEVALRTIKFSGVCGIVSPASLFNDQVSGKLRKWVFENYKVVDITYYPAELKLYGKADISSCTFVVRNGVDQQDFFVKTYIDKTEYKEKKIEKAIYEYLKSNDYCIPLKTGLASIPVMMKLAVLPATLEYCKQCSISFTRELDETKVSDKLNKNGKIEFAKGYMVDRYSFVGDGLFLNENIVQAPDSINMYKIVWRDVSRDSQIRRIKATLLPPGYICGNSLGVIYGKEDALPYMKMLLAIMNSLIYEFQARSLLVSNHVSAGVVKQIHVPEPIIDDEIIRLVDSQLAGNNVERELEVRTALLYNLSSDEYESVVSSFGITDEEKQQLIENYKDNNKKGDIQNMIYNHYASTLSELDMQVVNCVPPGGNWKDIPESVPSKRLEQIRESYKAGKGSRSTYYGRLRPEMPSYTINTYFNRPGNGCHMHYEQNRTLSQREAARFQSFPDAFEFIGSLGAINTQIGNAVPPLLAYQIAKSIPFKGQFIDLFCGAGGLALGFIWAGWKPIISNDIDKYAIDTHRRNIGGEAICGDINDEDIHNTIVSMAVEAKKNTPDLPLFVLGGPPCQGFSTANTRRGTEDLRNWLFKSYAKVVKEIQPDGFVFENVKGILNLDKGKFFEMIQAELKECVEDIKVNKIGTADFGVPQRRDRVIIVGGSYDLTRDFHMEAISTVQKDGQRSLLPTVIGAEDAIGDLPELTPGEDGSSYPYKFPASNAYQKFMRGEIDAEEYLKTYKE